MPTSSEFSGFPIISYTEEHLETRPTPLHEQPKRTRIDHQLGVIGQQHEHIVRIILVLWGHQECLDYIGNWYLTAAMASAEAGSASKGKSCRP